MRGRLTTSLPPRVPSVSRPLQILALLVLVLIVGATVQQIFAVRSAILGDAKRQMSRLDMAFAEQTGRTVETVDFILRDAVETLQRVRATPPVDPITYNGFLRRRLEGVRQISAVAMTDADGRIVYAAPAGWIGELPPEATALLQAEAAKPNAGLLFSKPLRGPDGKWTALMARRIPAPGGGFDGVALAYLNLAYFEDFYHAVELSENGAIVLHLRDGTILARYPHDDAAIGQSYAELPPFKDVLAHDTAGTVVMDGPLDGRSRVVAIRALKSFPLAVSVSVDEDMILSAWRRQTWSFALVAIIASGAIVTLLLMLARRSRQVESLVGEHQTARDTAEEARKRLAEQMEERERAEVALRQAQRVEAVGQLTGGVAHDFNNLLTVLIGNIDLIQTSTPDGSPLAPRLAAMRRAAERGATLTSHLLAFARRQPLLPRAVDLNGVITGMRDLLESALGGRVRMETTLAPDLWQAMVDPTQIELVILNLAINARDAMPHGGAVTVATVNRRGRAPNRPEDAADREYVVVTVSDIGTGMTPEVLAKAFEPFFTTKGPGSGSGLGLSQVFGTARQSGGDVHIDSRPGKGTIVTVYLPRAASRVEDRPATPMAPAQEAAKASTAMILLVDDDDAVRTTTADILQDLGYGIIQASGGEAALQMLHGDGMIDLLLTDIAMPGMNGPQLARQVRQMQPHLPIVFISGYADPEGLAGDVPLRRLVRKPYRPSELRDEIEAALREVGAPAA